MILLLCLQVALTFLPVSTHAQPAPTDPSPGRTAMLLHCQTCHALPEINHHDRGTWEREILPRMSYFTGVAKPPTNAFNDVDLLWKGGVFPTTNRIPPTAWTIITNHILSQAPAEVSGRYSQDAIKVGLPHFQVVPAKLRQQPPLTSFVKIDPTHQGVIYGDVETQGIHFLNARAEALASLQLGNIPVALAELPEELVFAAIGHFFPRDEPRAQLISLRRRPDGFERTVLLSGLPRTTDVQSGDLDGDGKPELVVSHFGNYLGRLSWYERTGPTGLKEHTLFDKPGTIATRLVDLDNNGTLDVVALIAQAQESVIAFLNRGKGRFEQVLLLQRPPSWGHSGFQIVDFDGDKLPDLLITNGDNADFSTSPTRPFHGIRLYRNEGNRRFKEVWFHHLNGAYKAIARDFDLDGDLDIAAISFFPDYTHSPRESFVYLQQTGPMTFEVSTFRECISGRWLVMDAGDIDGDGDEDLALGSLTKMPTEVPDFLRTLWTESGPSLLILRNTTRRIIPTVPAKPPASDPQIPLRNP